MTKWIDAGPAREFSDSTKKCLNLEGVPTVVCQVKGTLHAVANACPHAGLPLGEGDLAGTILTCPFHGYTYNVASGVNVDMPDDEKLPCYEVKMEGSRVMVAVPEVEDAAGDE